MVKEKRTKPCSNCKKSKVKCIYTSSLPCERCVKSGQAMYCQFMPKLPSLKLPIIHTKPQAPTGIRLPPLNPLSQPSQSHSSVQSVQNVQNVPNLPQNLPHQQSIPNVQNLQQSLQPNLQPNLQANLQQNIPNVQQRQQTISNIQHTIPHQPQATADDDANWKNQMENRINGFDNKLNDLVDILRTNQQHMIESQQRYNQAMAQQQIQYRDQYQIDNQTQQENPVDQYRTDSSYSSRSQSPERKRLAEPELPSKRQKLTKDSDFRDSVLLKPQAQLLFKFFDENISPQLFGFEISRFAVDDIWQTSPILICAICTIASIHHPDVDLSSKLSALKQHLHHLCGNLLYKGRPKSETDGFNTIVALVLCSFWLSDSQMFTGLALQLAKEVGLDKPLANKRKSPHQRDRLKLWYLLYVLDGQQSLTFNRDRLVNSNEYSLRHSKELLIKGTLSIEGPAQKQIEEKEEDYSLNLPDMRLVSQVEYNQALNEAFKGDAWDLINPSSFGIPSKSNLELDRWMVSWAVLLAPVHNGAIWLSKSTLIYYNFAKMHINSTAVRKLHMDTDSDDKVLFPKWDSSVELPEKYVTVEAEDSEDSDDSDEEEFVDNKEISKNDALVSANIAVNAAQTVLNLVLNDTDIISNLKYVPVHIHIMLYYAALLLINPPFQVLSESTEAYFDKSVGNLKTVLSLHRKIYQNLPTDKNFGERLISSLDYMVQERIRKVKTQVNDTELSSESKHDLFSQLETINQLRDSDQLTEINTGSPGPEKISAWPGSNHGHP